jgi:hypothetical protein
LAVAHIHLDVEGNWRSSAKTQEVRQAELLNFLCNLALAPLGELPHRQVAVELELDS